MTVRTERSKVRTKTTEMQYSPVRLEKARLVSNLLYGTLSLIVKCTAGSLHLKMFVFFIHLWNFGKNLFSFFWKFQREEWQYSHFFRCFGCKFWICRLRSKAKIHGLHRFHGNGPYCKILTEKEPIRAQGFAWLGLLYNKAKIIAWFLSTVIWKPLHQYNRRSSSM